MVQFKLSKRAQMLAAQAKRLKLMPLQSLYKIREKARVLSMSPQRKVRSNFMVPLPYHMKGRCHEKRFLSPIDMKKRNFELKKSRKVLSPHPTMSRRKYGIAL